MSENGTFRSQNGFFFSIYALMEQYCYRRFSHTNTRRQTSPPATATVSVDSQREAEMYRNTTTLQDAIAFICQRIEPSVQKMVSFSQSTHSWSSIVIVGFLTRIHDGKPLRQRTRPSASILKVKQRSTEIQRRSRTRSHSYVRESNLPSTKWFLFLNLRTHGAVLFSSVFSHEYTTANLSASDRDRQRRFST